MEDGDCAEEEGGAYESHVWLLMEFSMIEREAVLMEERRTGISSFRDQQTSRSAPLQGSSLALGQTRARVYT